MKPLVINKMNKIELEYANYLELLKKGKEIIDYIFEPMGLKLADKTYYHPDFLVVFPTHFEIHEVKGFLRDDANVKIKIAAQKFKWFKFRMIFYRNKEWIAKEIHG